MQLVRGLMLASACAVVVGAQAPTGAEADPRIRAVLADISADRLRQLATTLVSFGTRETLSTSTATRGIGAARQWIFDELTRTSPRLTVSFDTYQLPVQGRITRPVELRNVIAILPGRTPRRIYVTAHYDSLNLGTSQLDMVAGATAANPQARADFDHDAPAPGANDNGSGTVLVMELARVLAESGIDFDATLVFALWAGEEQGLVGSMAHVQRLGQEKVSVDAVFNNDIVGNSRGGNGLVDGESVRVYAVGPEDSASRALARHVASTAARYVPSHRVRLMAREDRFGRGSDHSSFTTLGFPAIVFREANEDFARQHSASDTIDGVDFRYLAENARVNAASVAALALAPPAPRVTSDRNQSLIARTPSGYDADLRWNRAPGAVSYRVYWRDTWENDWQHTQSVGNVTAFVLPNVPIDDYVFGVSAIGPAGHESLVSAFVAPTRAVPAVKVTP
jgi:hypothetical protein